MNATTQDKQPRTLIGRVKSAAMDRTITVVVERRVPHSLYGKYVRRSTRLHAHDEDNQSARGDLVRIAECPPLSKTKSWRLVEVIDKAADK